MNPEFVISRLAAGAPAFSDSAGSTRQAVLSRPEVAAYMSGMPEASFLVLMARYLDSADAAIKIARSMTCELDLAFEFAGMPVKWNQAQLASWIVIYYMRRGTCNVCKGEGVVKGEPCGFCHGNGQTPISDMEIADHLGFSRATMSRRRKVIMPIVHRMIDRLAADDADGLEFIRAKIRKDFRQSA